MEGVVGVDHLEALKNYQMENYNFHSSNFKTFTKAIKYILFNSKQFDGRDFLKRSYEDGWVGFCLTNQIF